MPAKREIEAERPSAALVAGHQMSGLRNDLHLERSRLQEYLLYFVQYSLLCYV